MTTYSQCSHTFSGLFIVDTGPAFADEDWDANEVGAGLQTGVSSRGHFTSVAPKIGAP